ncbi:MAG: indole-3-glycerol phosphate synthase TrpC [Deltaproteobacteria bacterium]|nr:indole-3-glycerol phosphate synthase TrpC [Deltaproteobacteria bacterium]
MSVLARIVAGTRARLAATPVDREALARAAAAAPPPPSAWEALTAPGTRVIAEVKRKSPSQGAIRADADPVAVARGYMSAGAAAISVLTEPDHFGGSLDDLRAVAAAVAAPCLRKDFVVDARQLDEARVAGASLVLLMASVLDDAELAALSAHADALGLAALVEAHDEREVERALAAGARILGVNNRDLKTLAVDLATAERLRPMIPAGVIAVAESGVQTRADVLRLEDAGYDCFLVGSSLMAAPDPARALAALLGRDAGGPEEVVRA